MLQDSESEDGEDGDSSVHNDTLGGDTENGEEKEKVTAQRNKKSRIRQGLLDSDDSDTGDHLQIENLDTSRKSVLSENEVEEGRPLKSGKKSRKHKHSFEDEAAEKAVGKPRRRKERERRAESQFPHPCPVSWRDHRAAWVPLCGQIAQQLLDGNGF